VGASQVVELRVMAPGSQLPGGLFMQAGQHSFCTGSGYVCCSSCCALSFYTPLETQEMKTEACKLQLQLVKQSSR
jgi:hypothetical protein